jgi:hypothetical protein
MVVSLFERPDVWLFLEILAGVIDFVATQALIDAVCATVSRVREDLRRRPT